MNPDFGVYTNKEVARHLHKRIKENWIIVQGPNSFFQKIEFGLYPPRTPKNELLEILSIAGKQGVYSFMIIKKTPELQEELGLNDKDYNALLFLSLDKQEAIGQILDIKGHETLQGKETMLYNWLNNMVEFIENGKRTRENVPIPKPKKQNKKSKRNAFTRSIRHEVFKRDNYRCKECGATNKETTLHIDHIVPVSKGGTDELDNLQTLCESCNLAKSNRNWKGGV